jgi:hypothetical protein
MSANITAIATLVCALATLVTAIGGVWIGIVTAGRAREHRVAMQNDMNDVKSDMFSLTSVMTQSIAPKKP